MTRKPRALINSEKNGVFTMSCKTKDEALKLMQEEIDEWQCLEDDEMEDGQIVVDIEEIKETYMYYHRKCSYYNFEQQCEECGEQCGTVGRKTFYFAFPYPPTQSNRGLLR
jgi:hypothetical protein